jgi:PPOX class probable F420-dependent enzyme
MPGYDEMIDAGGRKTLPWSWAVERLENTHNYWLTTVRPDGRPHVMPVWALWRDGRLEFSTGSHSRKARNLRANPNVVIATDDTAACVILEGAASIMPDGDVDAFIAGYKEKYDWQMDPSMGPFYIVTPAVAFGIIEYATPDTGGVTRWTFP